jgi:hypothetical protein
MQGPLMMSLFVQTDNAIKASATKALKAGKIDQTEFQKIEAIVENKFAEEEDKDVSFYTNLTALESDDEDGDAWSRDAKKIVADYKLPAKPAKDDGGLTQLQLKIIADLSDPKVKSAIGIAQILKKHLDAMIVMLE